MVRAGERYDALLWVYRCEKCGEEALVSPLPAPSRALQDESRKTLQACSEVAKEILAGREIEPLRLRNLAVQIDSVLRRLGR